MSTIDQATSKWDAVFGEPRKADDLQALPQRKPLKDVKNTGSPVDPEKKRRTLVGWLNTPHQKPKAGRSEAPNKVKKVGRRPKSTKLKNNADQWIIDAGQKEIGAKTCPDCGMTYNVGVDDDVHRQYHSETVIRFPGWLAQRIIWSNTNTDSSEYIVAVYPKDNRRWISRCKEIHEHVNKQLGSPSLVPGQRYHYALCIRNKTVIGCLVLEPVRKAFEILNPESITSDEALLYNKANPVTKMFLGVSRIWVPSTARRHGIARRLLRAAEVEFGCIKGTNLRLDLAFAQPTLDGRRFAKDYLESRNLYIY
eukprot:Clim_evm217s157 gene=Clim_evmTU217s157